MHLISLYPHPDVLNHSIATRFGSYGAIFMVTKTVELTYDFAFN